MRAKDLEQGKYYTSVELGHNGEVLRQRCWYITLREGDNIRFRLLELYDYPFSFYYTPDMSHSVNFLKDIFFMEVSEEHFMMIIKNCITKLQAIEL